MGRVVTLPGQDHGIENRATRSAGVNEPGVRVRPWCGYDAPSVDAVTRAHVRDLLDIEVGGTWVSATLDPAYADDGWAVERLLEALRDKLPPGEARLRVDRDLAPWAGLLVTMAVPR